MRSLLYAVIFFVFVGANGALASQSQDIYPPATEPIVISGGTVPDDHLIYMPVVTSYYAVSLPAYDPADLVLSPADMGLTFTLIEDDQADGPNYQGFWVEYASGHIHAASDVYVYTDLAGANVDYDDTVACYRAGDPGCEGLTEQTAEGIGRESALFKGNGEQFLFIFRKGHVVVIVGTQNMSAAQTIGLAKKIANKF